MKMDGVGEKGVMANRGRVRWGECGQGEGSDGVSMDEGWGHSMGCVKMREKMAWVVYVDEKEGLWGECWMERVGWAECGWEKGGRL